MEIAGLKPSSLAWWIPYPANTEDPKNAIQNIDTVVDLIPGSKGS